MEKLLFMKPLLEQISQGSFFRKIFAFLLKVLALVVLFLGIIVFIKAWKVILAMPTSGIIGGIIYQFFFIIAVYMVMHTLLIRACQINKLSEDDYNIVPIILIYS